MLAPWHGKSFADAPVNEAQRHASGAGRTDEASALLAALDSRLTIADHGETVSQVAERLRDALRAHADDWDQSALIRRLSDGQ
jgi:hypothetical protein